LLNTPIQVTSDQGSYPIFIKAGSWPELVHRVSEQLRPSQWIWAADQTVAELFGPALRQALPPDVRVVELTCPPGEASKCVALAESWWNCLAAAAVDRQAVLMAVGGGVVGDLAGFVAASYLRGLRLVQVPTTLLAQVDSSVGGKVAINLPAGKNLVGCFWQPSLVWIDPTVLSSLNPRQFAAGMAEVVKYAVIADAPLMDYLEQRLAAIQTRDPAVMADLIERCCRIKAEVVRRDPRETSGIRAWLNFGHTIGHAIESLSGYGTVLHGEAVAMGMVAETRLAQAIGFCSEDILGRLTQLLHHLQLPTALPPFSWEDWRGAMLRDKKNIAQRIAFALPQRLGQVQWTDAVLEEPLRQVVAGDRAELEPIEPL